MALLKVSDLEGLTYEQVSSNTQFKQALFEVSNPVQGETAADWAYKSQYIKADDLARWVMSDISDSNNAVNFLSGINVHGYLCADTDEMLLNSNQISVIGTESVIFKSPSFELSGRSGKVAQFGNSIGFYTNINVNGNRIQNLAEPDLPTDAVTKQYVDAISANIIREIMERLSLPENNPLT